MINQDCHDVVMARGQNVNRSDFHPLPIGHDTP